MAFLLCPSVGPSSTNGYFHGHLPSKITTRRVWVAWKASQVETSSDMRWTSFCNFCKENGNKPCIRYNDLQKLQYAKKVFVWVYYPIHNKTPWTEKLYLHEAFHLDGVQMGGRSEDSSFRWRTQCWDEAPPLGQSSEDKCQEERNQDDQKGVVPGEDVGLEGSRMQRWILAGAVQFRKHNKSIDSILLPRPIIVIVKHISGWQLILFIIILFTVILILLGGRKSIVFLRDRWQQFGETLGCQWRKDCVRSGAQRRLGSHSTKGEGRWNENWWSTKQDEKSNVTSKRPNVLWLSRNLLHNLWNNL